MKTVPKNITIKLQVDGLLSFVEAAKILGVTRPMIYNMIETGKLHRVDIEAENKACVIADEVERLKRNSKSKNNA
jgi:excisionase family DNA binding protein